MLSCPFRFSIATVGILWPHMAYGGVNRAAPDLMLGAGAVVVATVLDVDEDFGREIGTPATAYRLDVVAELSGSLDTEWTKGPILLVQLGGYMSDGSRVSLSHTTKLKEGTSYVLFLAEDYRVSPFLPDRDAVLERLEIGGRSVARSRDGRLLKASRTFGLQHLGPASDENSLRVASSWDEVVDYLLELGGRGQSTGTVARTRPAMPASSVWFMPYDAAFLPEEEAGSCASSQGPDVARDVRGSDDDAR